MKRNLWKRILHFSTTSWSQELQNFSQFAADLGKDSSKIRNLGIEHGGLSLFAGVLV